MSIKFTKARQSNDVVKLNLTFLRERITDEFVQVREKKPPILFRNHFEDSSKTKKQLSKHRQPMPTNDRNTNSAPYQCSAFGHV